MYLTCEITQHHELEAKEKKRLIYKAPLPRKSIRSCSYRSGRPCKVKQFTREEIENYAMQNDLAANRGRASREKTRT